MSGLDLLAKLEHEQLGIPVILISGHGDIPTAVRAMKTGAVDFLEKPVDPALLVQRIRHALAKAQRMSDEQRQRRDFAARLARLTPRERRVMDLVVAGRPTKGLPQLSQCQTVEALRAVELVGWSPTAFELSSPPAGREPANGPPPRAVDIPGCRARWYCKHPRLLAFLTVPLIAGATRHAGIATPGHRRATA
jgi:hypothetical protein